MSNNGISQSRTAERIAFCKRAAFKWFMGAFAICILSAVLVWLFVPVFKPQATTGQAIFIGALWFTLMLSVSSFEIIRWYRSAMSINFTSE